MTNKEWDEIKEKVFFDFPMVETKEEYEIMKEKDYCGFALEKFRKKAIELGHSPEFATSAFPFIPGEDRYVYKYMIELHKLNAPLDLIAYLISNYKRRR